MENKKDIPFCQTIKSTAIIKFKEKEVNLVVDFIIRDDSWCIKTNRKTLENLGITRGVKKPEYIIYKNKKYLPPFNDPEVSKNDLEFCLCNLEVK